MNGVSKNDDLINLRWRLEQVVWSCSLQSVSRIGISGMFYLFGLKCPCVLLNAEFGGGTDCVARVSSRL